MGPFDGIGNMDILCLAETNWSPSQAAQFTALADTHVHLFACRDGEHQHGGLSLFVPINIPHKVLYADVNPELIVISIGNQDLLLCATYIAPLQSPALSRDPYPHVSSVISSFPTHAHTLLVGDLNARIGVAQGIPYHLQHEHTTWPTLVPVDPSLPQRTSMDSIVNGYGPRLLNLLNDLELCVLNGRTTGDLDGLPTYSGPQGRSVLDWALGSFSFLRLAPKLVVLRECPFSDHCPIHVSAVVPLSGSMPRPSAKRQLPPLRWDEEDCLMYSQQVQQAKPQLDALVEDISLWASDGGVTMTTQFLAILRRCANRVRRHRWKREKQAASSSAPSRQLWWDQSCVTARQQAHISYTAHKQHPTDLQLRADMVRDRNMYRTLLKQKQLAAHASQDAKLLASLHGQPRVFWRRYKSKPTSAHSADPESFAQHLQTTSSPQHTPTSTSNTTAFTPITQVHPPPTSPTLDTPITVAEVVLAVRRMGANKSTADRCPGALFKYATQLGSDGKKELLLPDTLCTILNRVFMGDLRVPDSWLTAHITPVFKDRGDPSEMSTHRPITVTGGLYKLYASVLTNRVQDHLEINGLRSPSQHGFRKKLGTVTAIWVLVHLLHAVCGPPSQGGMKTPLHACLLDIRQAFDSIGRDRVWSTLVEKGISGRLLAAVQDLYRCTEYFVRSNGTISTTSFRPTKGVKQGCPLSPTLFSIVFERVAEHLDTMPNLEGILLPPGRPANSLLYADDTNVLSPCQEGLQALCDRASQFCEAEGLQINVAKTVLTTFLPWRHPNIPTHITLAGDEVDSSPLCTYLGLQLHEKRPWFHDAPARLAESAERAMWALLRRIKDLQIWALDTKLRLLDLLVVSVGSYASQVWGVLFCDLSSINAVLDNPLQRVILQFLRVITGSPDSVSRWALLEDMGILPIQARWVRHCVRHWNACVQKPGLLMDVLQADLHLFTQGMLSTWSGKFLRAMFDLQQFGSMSWVAVQALSPHVLTSRQFVEATVLTALKDHYGTLLGNLDSDPRVASSHNLTIAKLRTWMLPDSGRPQHLKLHAPFPVLRTLCRFRLSAFDLRVRDHTVRERSARVCPLCSAGVEDEQHVLLECLAYAPLRRLPRWAHLFAGRQVTMKSVMTCPDQYRLASFLVALKKSRLQQLQDLATPPPNPGSPVQYLDMFDSDEDSDSASQT